MSRISSYLFRQTAIAFLLTTVAVVFVILFTQSFRLLSFVVENSGTMLIFFKLIGLMIPTFLPLVVPLGLGIGVVFTYYKMAMDSELVVMRAAGISPLRLARPAVMLGIITVIICYGCTVWLTPWANRELVALQYKLRDNYSAALLRAGVFNDLADGLTFYARSRSKEGRMQGVLIHDVRQPERPVTVMAMDGQFSINESGAPQITVFKGKRQEMDRVTGRLSQLEFDRYVVDLGLLRNGAADRVPDAREQPLNVLLDPSGVTQSPHKYMLAEAHQRLGFPLLALSYTLIGITAIVSGPFNRRGMGKRIVIAATSIIVIQAAALSVGSLSGKNPILYPFIYGVSFLPVPVCLILLLRDQKTHQENSA